MFTLEDCISFINQIHLETYQKPLSDLKRTIIEGSWEGKSYQQIADRVSYSKDYINRDVAYELWNDLSQALGIKVSKNSFKATLYDCWQQSNHHPKSYSLSFSPLNPKEAYISRPKLEKQCLSTLLSPGALLRIKAPENMGKTLLLEYCLFQIREQGFNTIKVDLRLAEKAILKDLKAFLQWICITSTEELNLPDQLDHQWKDRFGLNMNLVRYFERYILQSVSSPLVLAFDNFDVLFSEPRLFQEFSKILRGMHESAKRSDRVGQTFQQLRIIVCHSTQAYPNIDINHSPFNVGTPIEIPPFQYEELEKLAKDQLPWSPSELQELIAILGGNPKLTQISFEWIERENLSFTEFQQLYQKDSSPFRTDLQKIWNTITSNPDLLQGIIAILNHEKEYKLHSQALFKLISMGVIKQKDEEYQISCKLYKSFFHQQLEE